MKDCSMVQYLSEIKQRVDAISAAGSTIEPEDIILYTLNGLPYSYNAFKTSIRTKLHPISLDDLYALLCSEETNLAALTAFRGRGRGRSRGRSSNQRGMRSQNSTPRGTRRNSTPVDCQICGKFGHSAAHCWHRTNLEYQPGPTQAFLAHEDPPPAEWFLDSGASSHLTSDISQVQSVQPYTGNAQVQVGNGNQLPIAHSGQGILPTPARKFQLKHLLHVPHLSHNLISVNRLIHDNKCYIIFDNDGFLIKDSQTHQILHRGTSRQGLYPIDLTSAWNQRLGHPAASLLHAIDIPVTVSTHKFNCDSCSRAKMHRLPFASNISRTTACFQILHTDLWGPSPVDSCQDFRYYMLFVDDFTRYSWIFLLKRKSEALQTFLYFKKLVENQFQTTIKALQSDRGGEYLNKSFQQCLKTFWHCSQVYMSVYSPKKWYR
ncbi:Retrovirus-related Pol polyprotein from transposon TNT 1-94 [Dendrobium catenatum]|uniref:Retrovirus-related Pol polyprotein from transposon TNT 1-94 n=1 Tax=Dendrobium catenatum TaxID=906689 RepID=A0A2I0X8I8_9ASPA|nr:Retrovirus-related Pol polyprotein from transposon TNT 1-94 [Dendrobium catenatum]